MNATLQLSNEVCLGNLESIPLGEGRKFIVHDRSVAIFRLRNGQIRAIDAYCPHQHGPLSDGIVGNCTVICPLHAWKFDLDSGTCINDPAVTVATHATRVEGGRIYVRLG